RALGVSRPSLYALIDAHPRLRKASELDVDEVRAALRAHDGDTEAAAQALEVSAPGLRQRCRSLDVS
ncbi:MAG: CUE domain-containing protein, partial [Acidobacteriota bacterium]